MVNRLPFADVRFAVSHPKADNAVSENEDRFRTSGDTQRLIVAVSDGASDGFFAHRWAEILTEAFCDALSPSEFTTKLPELREQWQAEATAAPLPWYAQARLTRSGAAATLLGLTVTPERTWEAIAVGDTNLFHLRGDKLITAFPLRCADDFSGFPLLVKTAEETPPFSTASGRGEPDDDLFLATDALAAWCLAEAEREGGAPWAWLRAFSEGASFERFLQEQRDLRRLQNDDTTLIHVQLGSGAE